MMKITATLEQSGLEYFSAYRVEREIKAEFAYLIGAVKVDLKPTLGVAWKEGNCVDWTLIIETKELELEEFETLENIIKENLND